MTQTPETQLKTAEARLAAALALREAGDLGGAVGRLRELLAEEGGFVRGWMELGWTLRRLGEREGALEAFGEAERLEPKHLQSRIEGAIELRALERFDEAEQKLLGVLQINPEQPAALFQLGEVYRVQRRFEEAIAQYHKTIETDPKNAWAKIQVAITYHESGCWDTAEEELKNFIKTNSEHPEAYFNLGKVYRSKKNFKEAILQYQKVLSIQPDHHWAQIHIAIIYREIGHYDIAKKRLTSLLKANPSHSFALFQLGEVYRLQKKSEKAIAQYKKALDSDFEAPWLEISIANACREIGELDKAEKHLIRFLDTNGAHPEALFNLGKVYRSQKKFEEALIQYKKG